MLAGVAASVQQHQGGTTAAHRIINPVAVDRGPVPIGSRDSGVARAHDQARQPANCRFKTHGRGVRGGGDQPIRLTCDSDEAILFRLVANSNRSSWPTDTPTAWRREPACTAFRSPPSCAQREPAVLCVGAQRPGARRAEIRISSTAAAGSPCGRLCRVWRRCSDRRWRRRTRLDASARRSE